MRIEEVKVYQYKELSEPAKEKAREWYKNCLNENFHAESEIITESMTEIVKENGIDIDGQKYPVAWSLNHSQGDYVRVNGELTEEKIEELLKENLTEKDWKWYERLKDIFYIRVQFEAHHYYGQQVEVIAEGDHAPHHKKIDRLVGRIHDELYEAAKSFINSVCRKLMKEGYDEIDYFYSDESVEQNIIDNEYEFTEDGKRW